MALEVEVLYDDLSRKRASIDRVDTLPKTGVLCIVLSTEWGNRRARVARLFSRRNREPFPWSGGDWYAIGTRGDQFFTYAWDDRDVVFHFRPLSDPHAEAVPERIERAFPPGVKATVFMGAFVERAIWDKALRIFDKEML